MKLFEGNDDRSIIYDNILLSKYQLLSIPKLSIDNLNINLELKYTFKNLDETLLIFWLFFILGNKIPKVKFSKFNKKLCLMIFEDLSLEFLTKLLENFLYNVKYSPLKYKNIKYLSGAKFLYSYKKNDYRINFFSKFSGVFKQNHLEHIFFDLGVSGIKLFFKVVFKNNDNEKNNVKVYKDILKLSDSELCLKNFMFEELNIFN
jgi:hypothetical protein